MCMSGVNGCWVLAEPAIIIFRLLRATSEPDLHSICEVSLQGLEQPSGLPTQQLLGAEDCVKAQGHSSTPQLSSHINPYLREKHDEDAFLDDMTNIICGDRLAPTALQTIMQTAI